MWHLRLKKILLNSIWMLWIHTDTHVQTIQHDIVRKVETKHTITMAQKGIAKNTLTQTHTCSMLKYKILFCVRYPTTERHIFYFDYVYKWDNVKNWKKIFFCTKKIHNEQMIHFFPRIKNRWRQYFCWSHLSNLNGSSFFFLVWVCVHSISLSSFSI